MMARAKWIPKGIGLLVLGGAVALAFPLGNYWADTHRTLPEVTEAQLAGKVSAFAKVAPVFEGKCFDCHSSKVQMPFYSQWPIAKQTITQDVESGITALDMELAWFAPGRTPSAASLAKLEEVLEDGDMPPLRYVALHWSAALTDDDKAQIRAWIAAERAARQVASLASPAHRDEPVEPLPLTVDADKVKVALGKALYHDTRLSGDGTLSCASCHALNQHGGGDGKRFSVGIRGQEGHINSPTVFNARYNVLQFWDGRAADLKAQAAGPVANPIEMGADWQNVVTVLNADAAYRAQFKQAYGADTTTQDLVTDAIATFESTLVTPKSAFDLYLMGNDAAITPEQLRGYQKFKALGCTTCHAGPALGGETFEKMGVEHDYFADRQQALAIALHESDNGRMNATYRAADQYRFKVPTLRNVAQTAPYFHDGTVKSLDEAVDKMAYYQLGQKLSAQDKADLVAFLQSLTGEYDGAPVK
jgi:cytochrome c peroxidase